MDKRTLDRFRKRLREQRDSLHLQLVSSRKNRKLSPQDNKDEGDKAAASIMAEMSAVQEGQAENLLRAINSALDKIDAGSFGECRNCGQEIAIKRLEAIPWTRYCITCQELIDSR